MSLNRATFIILIAVYAVTFFTQNNFRGASNVAPEVLREPLQMELTDKNSITFSKDDYDYDLKPLYNYELNGIIVHRMDYTWFSLYKKDSVFPLDLCMVWGKNVESGVYKNENVSYSQDARFCWWSWSGGNIQFNNNEISNNHLLISSDELRAKLDDLYEGDQIKIKGKLVDVSAKNTGDVGEFDPGHFSLKTSTVRDDTGAGACEIIFVEGIEIIKKGNPASIFFHKFSKYGILAWVVLNFILAIKYIFWSRKKFANQ